MNDLFVHLLIIIVKVVDSVIVLPMISVLRSNERHNYEDLYNVYDILRNLKWWTSQYICINLSLNVGVPML